MIHAREDYNRIQDPAGLIPEDEPVFLIRAQDALATMAICAWLDGAEANNVEPHMIRAVRDQYKRVLAWQADHGLKIPDMPVGSGQNLADAHSKNPPEAEHG